MNNLYAALPLIITFSIFAAYFGITFLIYIRFQTKQYAFLSLATGGSALLFFTLFFISLTGYSNAAKAAALVISTVSVMSVIASYMYYSSSKIEKWKTDLYVYLGVGIAILCSTVIHFISSPLSVSLTAILIALFIAYSIVKIVPRIPQSQCFQYGFIFFAGSILCHFLSWFIATTIVTFIANLFMVGAATLFITAFYKRIVEILVGVAFSAVKDGMTGLFNKAHFLKKVEESIRKNKAVAVIFSDIDNFKKLNDTQGHAVGDEILKLVAKIMQQVVGDSGVVGRYGGEEMVALITDRHADLNELAERFRKDVEVDTPTISAVTVSVGVSLMSPDDELTAKEFIYQSDMAMYQSKHTGKNRVTFFNESFLSEKPILEDQSITQNPTIENLEQPSLITFENKDTESEEVNERNAKSQTEYEEQKNNLHQNHNAASEELESGRDESLEEKNELKQSKPTSFMNSLD